MHRESLPTRAPWPPRSEQQHFLFEGLDYPATRQDLVDFATDLETDSETLNLVRSLPEHTYVSRDQVWRSIGEATRVLAGNRRTGSPRDDLGKQAVMIHPAIRHP